MICVVKCTKLLGVPLVFAQEECSRQFEREINMSSYFCLTLFCIRKMSCVCVPPCNAQDDDTHVLCIHHHAYLPRHGAHKRGERKMCVAIHNRCCGKRMLAIRNVKSKWKDESAKTCKVVCVCVLVQSQNTSSRSMCSLFIACEKR